ncbi:MAG: DUF87 domain-containing protein [Metallosphaera yellowstonensis]|jgi:Predicted ATPase
MDLGSVQLELRDVTRKCIAILGIRGSGKSNTAKVTAQELIREGVPVVVVDPDGEYTNLQAKVRNNFSVSPLSLASSVLGEGESVVLDMNEWNQEAFKFLLDFMTSLWELSKVYSRDVFILLEEAHEFIPQGERTELSDALTRIALRGRKRGLGMILVSQRSAKVNKDVLTQSEIYFLHKVVHPIDIKVYKEILPIKGREVEATVKTLRTGEAIFYRDGAFKTVKIRKFEPDTLIPVVETKEELKV